MEKEAEVKFAYDPQQEDELRLRVGEIVKNVVIVDDGWAEGQLDGRRGMFPDNFVEIRDVKKVERPPPPVPVAQPEEKPPPLPPASSKEVKYYKVTFAYEAANEDELALKLGDIVEFIEEEEVGWFRGKLGSQVGVFPSNFVEIMAEPEPSRPEPPKPDPLKQEAPKQESKPPAHPPPPEGETGIDGSTEAPAKPPPPAQTKPAGARMVMPAAGGFPLKPSDLKKSKPPAPAPTPGDRPPQSEPKTAQRPAYKPKKEAPTPPAKKEPTPTPPAARNRDPPPTAPKGHSNRDSTIEASVDGDSNFDGVPDHRPLDHVQRPKGPPRKPPSTARAPEPEPEPQPELGKAPWQREIKNRKSGGAPPPKPSEPVVKPTPPAATPSPKPAPTGPPTVSSTAPASGTSTPTNNEWKAAFEKLTDDFVKLKNEYRKDIDILTDDLDSERKRVRALEVEVDRLKKLKAVRDLL